MEYANVAIPVSVRILCCERGVSGANVCAATTSPNITAAYPQPLDIGTMTVSGKV